MSTFTETLPPTTTRKGIAIEWTAAERDYEPVCGTLKITTDRSVTEYLVGEFLAGWPGRAFALEKLRGGTDPEEQTYAVFVGNAGAESTCDCKGFVRYAACKHLAALTALILGNRI